LRCDGILTDGAIAIGQDPDVSVVVGA